VDLIVCDGLVVSYPPAYLLVVVGMFRYAGRRCVDSYVPVQYNIEYSTSTSLVLLTPRFVDGCIRCSFLG
jgi:hypothetical protein